MMEREALSNTSAQREITLIIIHCSATRADRDFTAKDVDTAHRYLGYSCWGYHYYIRKNGKIEKMRSEIEKGAHCYGHNAESIGVCYEGGIDKNGKPADTRTLKQVIALHDLVRNLWTRYPRAAVLGHRDLSPDRNNNGIIEKFERIKECPCFDVIPEMRGLRNKTMN
jgi:N-acetyl-anhydromuramyl-L-alanine amidase AmpD